MSSLSFQLLPGDIWNHILACLHHRFHDLFTASLVSKDFRLLALPHLYHAVYLDHPGYLKQLALRIAADDTSTLSVREHVKGLFIGRWVMQVDEAGCESKNDMESLKKILSVLPRLRHLTLEVLVAPQDQDIWEILRVKCTELRSFELFMLVGQPFFHDDFHFEHATLEPILLPLRNSPNLQSLELSFAQYPRGLDWLPNELFSALDDITFPHLHTLHLRGDIDPRFFSSFKNHRLNSLGRFFSRHSGLRSLCIDPTSPLPIQAIDPQVAEVVFPSLTRLEGPYLVCGSVMASTLADQLEDLKVTDLRLVPNAPLTLKSLPKLRKLLIGEGAVSPDLSIVEKLLSCTPGLEELVCGWQLEMPDEVLSVLSIVPELRILSLGAMPSGASKKAGWHERVPVFAEKCPKLQRMNRLVLCEMSWDILRGDDGKVTVMEYYS
ncbi:hypothetical protein FRC10_012125 [Ceratobasidium sp. 414]|nr:hypothetical protein FRC10_012125 [Ceratobasidium sp. 414]